MSAVIHRQPDSLKQRQKFFEHPLKKTLDRILLELKTSSYEPTTVGWAIDWWIIENSEYLKWKR